MQTGSDYLITQTCGSVCIQRKSAMAELAGQMEELRYDILPRLLSFADDIDANPVLLVTCAKLGCSNRIEYDPEEMKFRPRYCDEHMNYAIEPRGSNAFWIATNAGKPDIQYLIAPKPEIVVLRCPTCKSRATITKERFVAGDIPLCCGKKMLYHREQGDEHIHV